MHNRTSFQYLIPSQFWCVCKHRVNFFSSIKMIQLSHLLSNRLFQIYKQNCFVSGIKWALKWEGKCQYKHLRLYLLCSFDYTYFALLIIPTLLYWLYLKWTIRDRGNKKLGILGDSFKIGNRFRRQLKPQSCPSFWSIKTF